MCKSRRSQHNTNKKMREKGTGILAHRLRVMSDDSTRRESREREKAEYRRLRWGSNTGVTTWQNSGYEPYRGLAG